MWPFTTKLTIERSGLMSGFTDWHSHILPGVDDGVSSMQESLDILQEYERLGVRQVWLTPHIMEDTPNTPERLRERFAELQEAYTGSLDLHLAAENMLDNLFDERLEAGDVLPIGQRGTHLLVETSYFTPPTDLDDKFQRIKAKGYFPILAHPERYVYMDDKHYKRLLEEGILFQLNIYSFTGMYGKMAQAKAAEMLKKGWYTLIGTDTHHFSQLKNALMRKSASKSQAEKLRNLNSFF